MEDITYTLKNAQYMTSFIRSSAIKEIDRLRAELKKIKDREPDGYIFEGGCIKDGLYSKKFLDEYNTGEKIIPVYIGSAENCLKKHIAENS